MQRKNIFLHYLNRDSRHMYGLFRDIPQEQHVEALCLALDVSVLLCESDCISPPGFVIECDVAKEALRRRKLYLTERLIRFPMRERSVGDYIEKKRREYAPYERLYGGIYDETSLRFLTDANGAFLHRRSEIGKEIADAWTGGPDRPASLWKPIKTSLSSAGVEVIRTIPERLIDAGTAATWPAIHAQLPEMSPETAGNVRRLLQNNYFRLYLREYDLAVIRNLPWMLDDFGLASQDLTYDFRFFGAALSAIGIKSLVLNLEPYSLLRMKVHFGFLEFLGLFAEMGARREREPAVQILLGKAARATGFDVEKMAPAPRLGQIAIELSDATIARIGAGLSALVAEAHALEQRVGTESAMSVLSSAEKGHEVNIPLMPAAGDVVVFVALRSELETLIKRLKLTRGGMNGPRATGHVDTVPIDVVCPAEMGRVSAAIAMMRYLHERQNNLPKLIIIGGLAGGFKEEGAEAGHLIIGTNVIDLAVRKVHDQDGNVNTEFRRKDFRLDDVISRYVDSNSFDKAGWERAAIDEAEWPEGLRPALHHGLIASVDEVVSSDEWRNALLHATPKLLGVEMEAGGVCAAAESYKVPVALVRTVSDAADPAKKDDKWRTIGMKTLAILLEQIKLSEVVQYVAKRN
jgi:adenosylhomocysteine nucleosidase